MGTPGRKSTPSNQTRGLTYINAELKATNERLEQKIKSLQVAVTILLASTAGLGVGGPAWQELKYQLPLLLQPQWSLVLSQHR
jgi:hypothetical protein